jgi:hypothetical protein
MTSLRFSEVGRWFGVLSLVLVSGVQLRLAAASPEIAVIHATPVLIASADAAREGAAELMALMEIARVQSKPEGGGLVGVGDRHGLFSCDTEEALRVAVLDGIPVVKLAPRGTVLEAPHGLFLDGGNLSEDEARRVLASCILKFGALPKARSATPSARELAVIQNHLKAFQTELSTATRVRFASR